MLFIIIFYYYYLLLFLLLLLQPGARETICYGETGPSRILPNFPNFSIHFLLILGLMLEAGLLIVL